MKKYLLSLVILSIVTFSCSENSGNPSSPLSGNYLVYKTTDNLTGEVNYDYVKIQFISKAPQYAMIISVVFRNNIMIDTIEIKYSNGNVWLHEYPTFPGDSYCPYFTSWFPIKNHPGSWSYSETIAGDKYPSYLPDSSSPTGHKVVVTETSHEINYSAIKNQIDLFIINQNFKADYVRLTGRQLYYLVRPDTTQFIYNPDYEYLNNRRKLVVNDFIKEIWFIDDFVIAKYHEQYIRLNNVMVDRTSELVQYNVIF